MRVGIGDDAALVVGPADQELILTADMTLEGTHFRDELHPARAVGHRALARSLSDIAAMGGTPRYALVSLALTRGTARAWVKDFYAGVRALARRFEVALVGGDTAVVAGRTMIDVLVTGEVPPRQALLRSGARPGDQVFVSGRLGLSALGLRLLTSRSRGRTGVTTEAIRRHLYPEPQCALGRWLAARHLASALIDLSDGLSTDLNRLCQASHVGSCIWSESIPRPRLADKELSLRLALHGGEDYQLLFAVSPSALPRIRTRFGHLPLARIGEIQKRRGVYLTGRDGRPKLLEPGGWDYFRR